MQRLKIGSAPKMKVPLFDSGLVIFCRDWDAWQDVHKKIGINQQYDGSNGMSHTMASAAGTLHIIGVFNDKPSTLAHECAHMAFDICSRAGVIVEPGRANETYCHLISCLVEFCGRHMKKPE